MKFCKLIGLIFLLTFLTHRSPAQIARLTLDVNHANIKVSPGLYGLMTEEINHSYDGGLYAELIRNRIFKDNREKPEAWSVLEMKGGQGEINLVGANPVNVPAEESGNAINDALTTCLQLTIKKNGEGVGVANTGFWGIPTIPNTTYQASFYAKDSSISEELLNVGIMSEDGKKMYGSAAVKIKTGGWHKYMVSFKTESNFTKTARAKFVIIGNSPGKYFFNLVSLFPPTYKSRINGNRLDLMQMLAEMKPSFLRFPGGNFLEGDYFGTRFSWKNTLGPLELRPGHQGCWGYRASDGMGLLEFLEWCEDLHMEPLLAVYAGYSLAGDHIDAGPLLEPYVEDALDEIEYVTGGVNTKWGSIRAKNGHPKPFKLSYIEIGNEDWFDKSFSYDARFSQFRKAINSKYPNLHCISTIDNFRKGNVVSSKPDMLDEHYYRDAWQMEEDANHYDNYDRKSSPKIFVGEWATREGGPTTNMNAAIGDAAWMTGMERNSDIVLKAAYAPLLVNVNQKNDEFPKAWQWDSDLIGYDALTSFGSPSYYAQKMFNTHLGDRVVPVKGTNIPLKTATKKDSINTWEKHKKEIIPVLYYDCTKDSRNGLLYLKIVNASGNVVPVDVVLKGIENIASQGELIVLKSSNPDDTNTIQDPQKIIPEQTKIFGLKNGFTQIIKPYSINILKMHLLNK